MAPPATERKCILRLENISLAFEDDAKVLDNVSLEMREGDTKIILGAAGAGKTVMFKVALGLLKPTSGRIFLFGQDVTDFNENSWFEVRSHIGVLFQEGGLFDSLNIEENVAYPLVNRNNQTPEQAHARVEEALRFVELGHTLAKFPSELSGGMRRRVGIARAVVTQPELVLYDSPTAGLDPITAHTIISLILKERDTRNTASIMVTHRYQDGQLMANFRYNPNSGDIEPAPRGSEETVDTKFLIMREGRLVFEGTEQEFLAHPDEYVQKFARPGAS